jgi:hypothetical protein
MATNQKQAFSFIDPFGDHFYFILFFVGGVFQVLKTDSLGLGFRRVYKTRSGSLFFL